MTGKLIPPHGGHLVNLFAPESDLSLLLSQSSDFPHLPLDELNLADLECLATGLYSPLTGFINEDDYLSVLQKSSNYYFNLLMRLKAFLDSLVKLDPLFKFSL